MARKGISSPIQAHTKKVTPVVFGVDATAVTKYGGRAYQTSTGDTAWVNPNLGNASDNQYATAMIASGDASYRLFASNFGFNIPSYAVITGVLIEAETSLSSGSDYTRNQTAGISKNGSTSIGSLTVSQTVSTTDTFLSWGGSTSMFSTTLTAAEVNNSDFSVYVTVGNSAAPTKTFQVDSIRATIYYNTPTAYTILAGFGSYILTGYDTIFRIGKGLVAAYGSYTLTGQDSAFHVGLKLLASYGSYTLTGFSSNLKVGYKMLADYATYTLTGIAATLRKGKAMIAAYGSYALTGQAVIFRKGVAITAAFGSYVVTGFSARLLRNGQTIQWLNNAVKSATTWINGTRT